jgi:hypothetical protein
VDDGAPPSAETTRGRLLAGVSVAILIAAGPGARAGETRTGSPVPAREHASGELLAEPAVDGPDSREFAPTHWGITGADPDGHRLRSDRTTTWSGAASARFETRPGSEPAGYGATVQVVQAAPWRGRRVEFAARVKLVGERADARLWLRCDAADGAVVAFDNQAHRAPVPQGEWTRLRIVMDVPEDGARLLYGAILGGRGGTLWIDEASWRVVGTDVPPTRSPPVPRGRPHRAIDASRLPPAPRNLDFEGRAPVTAANPARDPAAD